MSFAKETRIQAPTGRRVLTVFSLGDPRVSCWTWPDTMRTPLDHEVVRWPQSVAVLKPREMGDASCRSDTARRCACIPRRRHETASVSAHSPPS